MSAPAPTLGARHGGSADPEVGLALGGGDAVRRWRRGGEGEPEAVEARKRDLPRLPAPREGRPVALLDEVQPLLLVGVGGFSSASGVSPCGSALIDILLLTLCVFGIGWGWKDRRLGYGIVLVMSSLLFIVILILNFFGLGLGGLRVADGHRRFLHQRGRRRLLRLHQPGRRPDDPNGPSPLPLRLSRTATMIRTNVRDSPDLLDERVSGKRQFHAWIKCQT